MQTRGRHTTQDEVRSGGHPCPVCTGDEDTSSEGSFRTLSVDRVYTLYNPHTAGPPPDRIEGRRGISTDLVRGYSLFFSGSLQR